MKLSGKLTTTLEDEMPSPHALRKFASCLAILVAVAALAFLFLVLSRGTAQDNESRAANKLPQAKCSFSDGSTIAFGREASGTADDDSWHTGEYDATNFRASEPMFIPDPDKPIKIPAGSHTLFVIAKGQPPWTLIISKKTGEWGMPYPGEQYDFGRTGLGSDVRPPVDHFSIGCTQRKDSPMFVWMQSGRYVGYAKIMAERVSGGKTEYLVH